MNLAVQLSRKVPRLIFLDRDEFASQATRLAVERSPKIVLADIRDNDASMRVFLSHRPEIGFHAAALRHLSLLGAFPEEAGTHVLGTQNILKAALAGDTQRFMNISTKKTAHPVSVPGQTKKIAEDLTAWDSAQGGRKYSSIPIWKRDR